MSKKNTIFVQIASYRDPQLLPTIKNLIENSKYPKNIHIGICWQHGDDETTEMFLDEGFTIEDFSKYSEDFDLLSMSYGDVKLSVIDVPYTESRGACWARNSIQQLYVKEKYTLQLDSHHRFVEQWDDITIKMLESLRSDDCKKPLLTGYIPSFDPDNDPQDRVQEAWEMGFDRFIPEGAVFFVPAPIEGWKELDKPINARFYSAHFCFTDGIFCQEVQHDPEYFFHGEEISIAVRAYTHGYDLYHPHRIIAWHEYTRKNRTKIWDDHTSEEESKGKIELNWYQRNINCHKRNRILFGMDGEDPDQINFGKYGFGSKRSLREYEEYAGISFKYRGVQQDTLDKLHPPVNFKYLNEEEWKKSFSLSNDVRILVHKDELGDVFMDDYDFFYVGTHDEEGKEISRKDLQKHEIYEYFKNSDLLNYPFIFISSELPVTYTVWAHSESNGWQHKITKKIDYN